MVKSKMHPSVKAFLKRAGSIGGKKAASNMTPEQRSDRARKAVAAREQRKERG